MTITYRRDAAIDADTFVDLYRASTLGERRPIDDPAIVRAMIDHANLTITAWADGLLVGIARTMTDFSYVGYLADLAVRMSHQRQGIGTELIEQTRLAMGPRSMLVLLAAPGAADYYPRLGFDHMPGAWLVRAATPLVARRKDRHAGASPCRKGARPGRHQG